MAVCKFSNRSPSPCSIPCSQAHTAACPDASWPVAAVCNSCTPITIGAVGHKHRCIPKGPAMHCDDTTMLNHLACGACTMQQYLWQVDLASVAHCIILCMCCSCDGALYPSSTPRRLEQMDIPLFLPISTLVCANNHCHDRCHTRTC